MSVAFKSSQLTVTPGDSITSRLGDSPSRTGGLAGQKNANKNEANILDQTRLANWPKRELFLVQPRQPWKPQVANGPILPVG